MMTVKLQEMALAPDFLLQDQNNHYYSLNDFLPSNLILYFYPKDNTKGCTQQAIDFEKFQPEFEKINTKIVGISPDNVASHQKFIKNYNLSFTLLSDPDKKAIKAYDLWIEKTLYGRNYMGVDRTTYLIDKTGHILKLWPKVKIKNHVQEVLASAQQYYDR